MSAVYEPDRPAQEQRDRAEALAEGKRLLAALAQKYRTELLPAVHRATRSYLVALLDRARAEVIALEFDGAPGFESFSWLVGTSKTLAEVLADAVSGQLIAADDPVITEVETFLKQTG